MNALVLMQKGVGIPCSCPLNGNTANIPNPVATPRKGSFIGTSKAYFYIEEYSVVVKAIA